MAESTINAKGQTTVPAAIRRLVKAEAGTRLVWTVLSDSTVIVRAKSRDMRELAGMLDDPKDLKLSIEDTSR